MSGRSYLSIGDVLSLLREEFPDVTISKIRFLESQGLVDPERSPSGYRKFYDQDVARLRWVLRKQRDQFLPLRVIRDRLAAAGNGVPPDDDPADVAVGDAGSPEWAGELQDSAVPVGAHVASAAVAPGGATRGAGSAAYGAERPGAHAGVGGRPSRDPFAAHEHPADEQAGMVVPEQGAVDRAASGGPQAPTHAHADGEGRLRAEAVATHVAHDAARAPAGGEAETLEDPPPPDAGAPATRSAGETSPAEDAVPAHAPQERGIAMDVALSGPGDPHPRGPGRSAAPPLPAESLHASLTGVSLTLAELCAASALSPQTVASLEASGLLSPMSIAGGDFYDEEALTVAKLVVAFERFGIEPRHLRLFRNAADREVGLIEQVVAPLLRQRNPEARHRAIETATELASLGQSLRAALVRSELHRQLGT